MFASALADVLSRKVFQYLSSGRLMSIPIQGNATPSVGTGRAISPPLSYAPFTGSGRTCDVSPDGKRFPMLDTSASVSNDPFAGLRRFEIVLNWTDVRACGQSESDR
jgi:hypothetical protein